MRVIISGSKRLGNIPKRPKPSDDEMRSLVDMQDFFRRRLLLLWKDWKDQYGPITEVVCEQAVGISSIGISLSMRITGRKAKEFKPNWMENKNLAGIACVEDMARYADGGIFIVREGDWLQRKLIKKLSDAGLPVMVDEWEPGTIDLMWPDLASASDEFADLENR